MESPELLRQQQRMLQLDVALLVCSAAERLEAAKSELEHATRNVSAQAEKLAETVASDQSLKNELVSFGKRAYHIRNGSEYHDGWDGSSPHLLFRNFIGKTVTLVLTRRGVADFEIEIPYEAITRHEVRKEVLQREVDIKVSVKKREINRVEMEILKIKHLVG